MKQKGPARCSKRALRGAFDFGRRGYARRLIAKVRVALAGGDAHGRLAGDGAALLTVANHAGADGHDEGGKIGGIRLHDERDLVGVGAGALAIIGNANPEIAPGVDGGGEVLVLNLHAKCGGIGAVLPGADDAKDRKSTRLNSSHVRISYAV